MTSPLASTSPVCFTSGPTRSPSSHLRAHLTSARGMRPAPAVGDTDLGMVGGHFQHGGKLPDLAAGRDRRLGELLGPVVEAFQFRHRAAPAMAPVIGDQAVAQAAGGDLLKLGIDRRADGIAALVKLLLAEAGRKLTPDLLGEVIGDDIVGFVAAAHFQRLRLGLLRLLRRDVAVFLHAPDHPVPPGDGGVMLADGMIIVRRLGQGRQISRFGDRQLVQRLVEIVQSRPQRRRRSGCPGRFRSDKAQGCGPW